MAATLDAADFVRSGGAVLARNTAIPGRPHRTWRHRNHLRLHHQAAPPDAVPVAKRFDCDQLFARSDFATDDPIERAAGEHLLDALGRHPGDMDMMGRLALLFGSLHPFGNPLLQVLDGIATDAKLDQMKRHFDVSAEVPMEWI